ncbi:hypothetical protein EDD85DRAFT_442046 [Armillaria nabsnona]|nr:hypothetical protein EDD85DRAFT_442046 [Armillaria nabsnona]
MKIFRRKGQNDSSGSQPSLALPSSNTPAQVAGSLSNDAVSVINKLFRRGKRGHTDTTGDVTTTSGNKTANAAAILGIVQAICEVLDKVPYVKVVTGLANTAIKIVDEVDACKREWDKVKVNLLKVRDAVLEFRHGRDDSAPLPGDIKAAFRELETCLMEVLEAVRRYQDVSAGRQALERSALKEDAMLCVGHIDMAIKVFQMKILVGTHLIGEQTHHIVEKILAIVLSIQQGPHPSI